MCWRMSLTKTVASADVLVPDNVRSPGRLGGEDLGHARELVSPACPVKFVVGDRLCERESEGQEGGNHAVPLFMASHAADAYPAMSRRVP